MLHSKYNVSTYHNVNGRGPKHPKGPPADYKKNLTRKEGKKYGSTNKNQKAKRQKNL